MMNMKISTPGRARFGAVKAQGNGEKFFVCRPRDAYSMVTDFGLFYCLTRWSDRLTR
jgi:hypothetical protein